MAKDPMRWNGSMPPRAWRTDDEQRVAPQAGAFLDDGSSAAKAAPARLSMPLALGAAAALMVGFVFNIGPWGGLTGQPAGTAGAQEAVTREQSASDLAVPSEADRAALRYFAGEGDVDRLDAELRRLRALYPNWQPPRDLLDPQGEDLELQRVYALVGEQRYEDARAAIAERRQRDPTYEPPARLMDIITLADARRALRLASDAQDDAQVLRIAGENERMLTCEDVDSIWRVAEAFARTERVDRAFDAYAYVIENCEVPAERAASLQKAAEALDATAVGRLFELGKTDESGANEFEEARLGIIRSAVARGGTEAGAVVPIEWLEILAEDARTGQRLEDAMLVGFYLLRQGAPKEAAQWFRFALESGLGSDAAEAYVQVLRSTANREDEFLAREVAYQWRDQSPELMEAYLDAMATILTADDVPDTSINDVEQASVDRYVPVVISQRDPAGAQALGWYAFNTCQFIIAEEWFITSANWVPTEAAIFGLALSRLRLGDQAGFEEVVDEWGALYPAVRGLTVGESVDPAAPVARAPDDPTDEAGLDEVNCDPLERERLSRLIINQPRRLQGARDPVVFTQAGSLTSMAIPVPALTQRPRGQARPPMPRRPAIIAPEAVERDDLVRRIQAIGPPPLPTPLGAQQPQTTPPAPPLSPVPNRTAEPSRPVFEQRSTGAPGTLGRPASPSGAASVTVRARPAQADTVTRRVRQGEATQGGSEAARVRSIVSGGGGSAGGSAAQQALAARNFNRCISLTDNAIRRGKIAVRDATARGFCLLELERPIEAARAFDLARLNSQPGTADASDAVYGSTLAAVASNFTDEASILAASGPLSGSRRTETQISILTQRAVAANRTSRTAETVNYLHQRNQIAPLQKDLMVLQGVAYLNGGDTRAAERILRAVAASGANSDVEGALFEVMRRRYPAPSN